MKPRIFIGIHYMEIGGAESSLIGLLEALDSEKVDVDLFVYSHQGMYMKVIPDYINLLPEEKSYSMFEKPLWYVIKHGYWKVAVARLFARYKSTLYYWTHSDEGCLRNAQLGYMGKYVSRISPDLYKYGVYDLAISYVTPHDFILHHVKAKKKVAWIHTDYSKISINTELEGKIWKSYDKIISISPDVTKGFLKKFPFLERKIMECENILPEKLILRKANSAIAYADYKKDGVITLCSVGRINQIKNHHNFPKIARLLKDMGLNFQWFLIGPGLWEGLNEDAKKEGSDDVFHAIGPSENPYPYIKNCDIFVHPSRFEGKSIVVREAQILCKPVIITNYPTAKSQIMDGVDGIICDLENKKIAEAIFVLANDSNKQNEIIKYLENHDFAGIMEVEKIYKLL